MTLKKSQRRYHYELVRICIQSFHYVFRKTHKRLQFAPFAGPGTKTCEAKKDSRIITSHYNQHLTVDQAVLQERTLPTQQQKEQSKLLSTALIRSKTQQEKSTRLAQERKIPIEISKRKKQAIQNTIIKYAQGDIIAADPLAATCCSVGQCAGRQRLYVLLRTRLSARQQMSDHPGQSLRRSKPRRKRRRRLPKSRLPGL